MAILWMPSSKSNNITHSRSVFLFGLYKALFIQYKTHIFMCIYNIHPLYMIDMVDMMFYITFWTFVRFSVSCSKIVCFMFPLLGIIGFSRDLFVLTRFFDNLYHVWDHWIPYFLGFIASYGLVKLLSWSSWRNIQSAISFPLLSPSARRYSSYFNHLGILYVKLYMQ